MSVAGNEFQIGIFKRGVAQTESKREFRLDVFRIVPAVADQQAFLVEQRAVRAGIGAQRVRRRIHELFRIRAGQLARRIHVAEQDAGNRRAAFHARIPGLQDGRRLSEPRIHFDGGTRNQNHHRPGIGFDDLPDQFALSEGQMQIGAVPAFVVQIAGVMQTRDDDGDVGLLGGGNGAFDQVGTTALAVTHRVGDVHVAARALQDAVQRRDFMHGLDAGAKEAGGMVMHGVLANDRERLDLGGIERKQVVLVFQQDDGFFGDA